MVEIKKFEELEKDEIYQIAQLRNDIFIHEQSMDMRNLDAMDYIADHAFIKEGYSLVCYMRIHKIDEKNKIYQISRVVTHRDFRGKSLAKKLLTEVMEYIDKELDAKEVRIMAQEYVSDYYASFGFKREGEVFDDGGIEHIWMKRCYD